MKAGWRVIKKALGLLTPREQKKLGILALATMGMALMELVGVVSVLPFMTVATNPDTVHSNAYLSWAYETFNFQSTNRFLVALGALSLIALVVGNSFRALSNFLLLRFAHMQNHYLAKRVLESYLSMPYEYFLTQNTSDLTKNVLTEVNQTVNGVFVPMLKAMGRAFAALFIVGMLVLMDPLLAALVTTVLGGAYFIIYQLFKRQISTMANLRNRANRRRIRLVSEAGGGIKDIKLMNKERTYLKDFDRPSKEHARAQTHNAIIGQLPRYILEVIAFGGVLLTVIYFIATRESYAEAISVTALYAFAGYKLMPALQEVFNAVTKMRFAIPALDGVSQNLHMRTPLLETPPRERLLFQKEIRLKNVSFSYREAQEAALKNLNLTIAANTAVGIIGPTGSGKTTLVDVILGLLRPCEGELIIDGVSLNDENLQAWQANIGYVPQFIYLTDDTVAANIAFGVSPEKRNIEKIKQAAELAQIAGFIENEMPKAYETVVGERGIRLSGGQRQRIGIARALYHDPSLLVLDEATSALDNKTEKEVMAAIDNIAGKKTIIMIAHRLSTLEKVDKLLQLEKGHLLEEGRKEGSQLVESNSV